MQDEYCGKAPSVRELSGLIAYPESLRPNQFGVENGQRRSGRSRKQPNFYEDKPSCWSREKRLHDGPLDNYPKKFARRTSEESSEEPEERQLSQARPQLSRKAKAKAKPWLQQGPVRPSPQTTPSLSPEPLEASNGPAQPTLTARNTQVEAQIPVNHHEQAVRPMQEVTPLLSPEPQEAISGAAQQDLAANEMQGGAQIHQLENHRAAAVADPAAHRAQDPSCLVAAAQAFPEIAIEVTPSTQENVKQPSTAAVLDTGPQYMLQNGNGMHTHEIHAQPLDTQIPSGSIAHLADSADESQTHVPGFGALRSVEHTSMQTHSLAISHPDTEQSASTAPGEESTRQSPHPELWAPRAAESNDMTSRPLVVRTHTTLANASRAVSHQEEPDDSNSLTVGPFDLLGGGALLLGTPEQQDVLQAISDRHLAVVKERQAVQRDMSHSKPAFQRLKQQRHALYEKRKLELIEQTKAKTDALEGLQAALTVLLEQSKLLHEQRQRLRERERQLDASYESAMQRIRQLEERKLAQEGRGKLQLAIVPPPGIQQHPTSTLQLESASKGPDLSSERQMIDSSVAAERTAAQAVFTGQAEEAEVAGKPGHQSPLHREQPAAGLIELEGASELTTENAAIGTAEDEGAALVLHAEEPDAQPSALEAGAEFASSDSPQASIEAQPGSPPRDHELAGMAKGAEDSLELQLPHSTLEPMAMEVTPSELTTGNVQALSEPAVAAAVPEIAAGADADVLAQQLNQLLGEDPLQAQLVLPSDLLDDLPGLYLHPGAVEAHELVVRGHRQRLLTAQKQNGNRMIRGRPLDGYASRCGALPDPSVGHVTIGCGTALADVHYHCHRCRLPDGASEDPEERDSDDELDCSLDYCEACARANDWQCPNPDCLSTAEQLGSRCLVAKDYLQHRGLRDFARDSEALTKQHYSAMMHSIANANYRAMKGALDGLPAKCRPDFQAPTAMYQGTPDQCAQHKLFENGLDQGVPVLVINAARMFDNEPFTPESMQALALEDAAQSGFVIKAQFEGSGGATMRTDKLSVEKFFAPMLNGAKAQFLPADPNEGADHAGFKAPDFGIQPVEQSRAFVDGMDRLGFGETVKHEGIHNLTHFLRSEKEDHINGTQKPDLGPKFYIARPKILRRDRLGAGGSRFYGNTFTPLHCDLADAVNYSCFGEQATWSIFHRKDRHKLMKYLEDEYGDGRKGVDMLWNPSNHRLLDEDDFKTLADERGVHAWHFQQRAGQLVVIPAGCAHQVRNGSSGWNIKVAQDFIAPQSAGVCLQLLSEMREARQEDKVQAILTLRFAGAAAFKQRHKCQDYLDIEDD